MRNVGQVQENSAIVSRELNLLTSVFSTMSVTSLVILAASVLAGYIRLARLCDLIYLLRNCRSGGYCIVGHI